MSRFARIWETALKAASLRQWALFAAGPALTSATAAMVLIVWDSRWPIELRGKQLDFLGYTLLGCLALVGVVVVTIAAVKVKGTGPGGTSIEIDADDAPATTVTTTTTVEPKP